MECDAARELNLRAQPGIRDLLLDDFRALERVERSFGVTQGIGDRRQAAHGVRLAPQVVDLAADLERFGKGRPGGIPVVQVLVRPPQVMERDHLLPLQTGLPLCRQGPRIDVARLDIIAHAIVEGGDAVESRQRVQRFLELLEQGIGAPQLDQAGGIVAQDSQQVAPGIQAQRKHLIVVLARRDGHGLGVLRHRLGVVPRVLQALALAGENPGAQSLPLRLRQQGRCRGDFPLRGGRIALGLVVAEEQPRADLEIGIRILFQQLERFIGLALARIRLGPHCHRALLDERLDRIEGGGRAGRSRLGILCVRRQWRQPGEQHQRRRYPDNRIPSADGRFGSLGHLAHAPAGGGVRPESFLKYSHYPASGTDGKS